MRRALALALLTAATTVAGPAPAHADSGPSWPASCVYDHTTLTPPRVEGYYLIVCIAPILP